MPYPHEKDYCNREPNDKYIGPKLDYSSSISNTFDKDLYMPYKAVVNTSMIILE